MASQEDLCTIVLDALQEFVDRASDFSLYWNETRKIHKNYALGTYGMGAHICNTIAILDKRLLNITHVAKFLNTERCVDVSKWLTLPKTLELMAQVKKNYHLESDSDVFLIVPDSNSNGKHHRMISGIYITHHIFPHFYSWVNPTFNQFLSDRFQQAGVKKRKDTYLVSDDDNRKIQLEGKKMLIEKLIEELKN